MLFTIVLFSWGMLCVVALFFLFLSYFVYYDLLLFLPVAFLKTHLLCCTCYANCMKAKSSTLVFQRNCSIVAKRTRFLIFQSQLSTFCWNNVYFFSMYNSLGSGFIMICLPCPLYPHTPPPVCFDKIWLNIF